MNLMQKPEADLLQGTVPAWALRSHDKTLFGQHLYLVGKCCNVPQSARAPCNVNAARE